MDDSAVICLPESAAPDRALLPPAIAELKSEEQAQNIFFGYQLYVMFAHAVRKTDGLVAALLTDRDGVEVTKAGSDDLPKEVLDPAFSAMLAAVSNQADFDKTKMAVSTFEQYQIVQFNHSPLILTLLASGDMDTGSLQNASKDLQEVIATAAKHVQKRAGVHSEAMEEI
ncbi:mitogen-activated protein kinase [Blyttiomyces helicus]|uniref:Mitogen-activated protein kinase n=1 Tax=Blyttiomyces helicus TaxID=388810 RepID=A0A4P9WBY3_9FUNG|nr:mitogen-activated protein kinase [Blyttiomyces helicus]|eukprot:RKO88688.1 mitogen-activated protein kinase [Blyttiomyces helicus]